MVYISFYQKHLLNCVQATEWSKTIIGVKELAELQAASGCIHVNHFLCLILSWECKHSLLWKSKHFQKYYIMWMLLPPLSEVPFKSWFQENIWQSKLSFKNAFWICYSYHYHPRLWDDFPKTFVRPVVYSVRGSPFPSLWVVFNIGNVVRFICTRL